MTRVVAARYAAVVAAVLLTLWAIAHAHLVEALGLGVLLVPLFVWAGDAHNAATDARNAEAKAAHAHVGTQRLKPLNERPELLAEIWRNGTDEALDAPSWVNDPPKDAA